MIGILGEIYAGILTYGITDKEIFESIGNNFQPNNFYDSDSCNLEDSCFSEMSEIQEIVMRGHF